MKEKFIVDFDACMTGNNMSSRSFPTYKEAYEFAVLCMTNLPFERFRIDKYYVR